VKTYEKMPLRHEGNILGYGEEIMPRPSANRFYRCKAMIPDRNATKKGSNHEKHKNTYETKNMFNHSSQRVAHRDRQR
jgi:hypothetical protein